MGVFQFSPGLRRRRLRWHRAAWRVLIPCGLVAAGTRALIAIPWPIVAGALVGGR